MAPRIHSGCWFESGSCPALDSCRFMYFGILIMSMRSTFSTALGLHWITASMSACESETPIRRSGRALSVAQLYCFCEDELAGE